MKIKIFDVILWGFAIVFIGLIFALPETVPIHWNATWEIDGYGSRYSMLIFAFMPLGIYYLMLLTMNIDPKRKSFYNREKTYHLIRKLLAVLFMIIGIFFYYMTLNPEFNGTLVMMLLLGIMFIGLGNYMPKVPQNYFLGVKTPWTLANEIVWKKTNVFGGYTFVIFGLICIACGLTAFKYSFVVIIAGAIIDCIISYVYSYYIYKKLGL